MLLTYYGNCWPNLGIGVCICHFPCRCVHLRSMYLKIFMHSSRCTSSFIVIFLGSFGIIGMTWRLRISCHPLNNYTKFFLDVLIDYGWIEWHKIFVEHWGVLGCRFLTMIGVLWNYLCIEIVPKWQREEIIAYEHTYHPSKNWNLTPINLCPIHLKRLGLDYFEVFETSSSVKWT